MSDRNRPAEMETATCCGGGTVLARDTVLSPETPPVAKTVPSCCESVEAVAAKPLWRRADWLLWGSGSVIILAFLASPFVPHDAPLKLGVFAHAVVDMMAIMWWGILIGMVAVGLIDKVPREFVIGIIGRDQGAKSLVRAVLAGVLLDLCSHGVLMVGAKLYERGASLAQVFAFLIASPWNSLSLTIIIGLLMGWGWLAVFLLASLVIAFTTGLVVEALERAGRVKPNPNRIELPEDFDVFGEAKRGLKAQRYDMAFLKDVARRSVTASRMVLRWLFFGVVLAALIQATVPTEVFATWFGATLLGLFTTLIAATVIEVCSEGSVPIASDLMARAEAPGNAFTFLMAGVATDYTEFMILREVTGRIKAALLLPLLTVPQILLIGWMINLASAG
ncbi:MAG: permease [Pseudomonadota bacterium]